MINDMLDLWDKFLWNKFVLSGRFDLGGSNLYFHHQAMRD